MKYILFSMAIILVLFVSCKAIETWEEIKREEIDIKKITILYEVCENGGTLNANSLTCNSIEGK